MLIFNDVWDGICEGEGDAAHEEPKMDKRLAIWKNRDEKAYAPIFDTVSEEVSRHISYDKNSYYNLKKFKDLYGPHTQNWS